MSDDRVMVSAAPFDPLKKPVASTADINHPRNDYQIADLGPLPSKEVLQEIGRAAIRFGQLEHLLKVIFTRSDQNFSLEDSLEKLNGGSLGALLNGIRYGEIEKFEGLIKLAESNSQLASVKDQLQRVLDLSPTRKRYVHNGIGMNSDGEFFFLHTGERVEESKMFAELVAASTAAESLIPEINEKLPPRREE